MPGLPTYRRLPGTARRFFGVATLWSGPDHLLLVERRGFFETYRRFYHGDVQAIAVRRTRRGRTLGSLLILAIVVFAALGAGAASRAERMIWMVPLASCVLLLGRTLFLGPTCVTHITTVLQTIALPPLNRLRGTRRTLARVVPLIERVQGSLSSEQILARAADAPPSPFLAAMRASPGVAASPVRRERGVAHVALFGLMLADAALAAFALMPAIVDITPLSGGLLLAQLVTAVLALMRQNGSDLQPGLRRATWAALIFVCVTVCAGMGAAMARNIAATLRDARSAPTATMTRIPPLTFVGGTVIGLIGLNLLRARRRDVASLA